jgi:hypothetical protein
MPLLSLAMASEETVNVASAAIRLDSVSDFEDRDESEE